MTAKLPIKYSTSVLAAMGRDSLRGLCKQECIVYGRMSSPEMREALLTVGRARVRDIREGKKQPPPVYVGSDLNPFTAILMPAPGIKKSSVSLVHIQK